MARGGALGKATEASAMTGQSRYVTRAWVVTTRVGRGFGERQFRSSGPPPHQERRRGHPRATARVRLVAGMRAGSQDRNSSHQMWRHHGHGENPRRRGRYVVAPTARASWRHVRSQGKVIGRCKTIRRTERSTHTARSEHAQPPQPRGVVSLGEVAGPAHRCLRRDRADEPRRCRQEPGRIGHELSEFESESLSMVGSDQAKSRFESLTKSKHCRCCWPNGQRVGRRNGNGRLNGTGGHSTVRAGNGTRSEIPTRQNRQNPLGESRR